MQIVYGYHLRYKNGIYKPTQKKYAWYVPDYLIDKVEKGYMVLAKTEKGYSKILVSKVTEIPSDANNTPCSKIHKILYKADGTKYGKE